MSTPVGADSQDGNAAGGTPPSPPPTTTPGTPRKRTAEEQEVIDLVARDEGREWAERHAHLVLEQARLVGQLPESEE